MTLAVVDSVCTTWSCSSRNDPWCTQDTPVQCRGVASWLSGTKQLRVLGGCEGTFCSRGTAYPHGEYPSSVQCGRTGYIVVARYGRMPAEGVWFINNYYCIHLLPQGEHEVSIAPAANCTGVHRAKTPALCI